MVQRTAIPAWLKGGNADGLGPQVAPRHRPGEPRMCSRFAVDHASSGGRAPGPLRARKRAGAAARGEWLAAVMRDGRQIFVISTMTRPVMRQVTPCAFG